jgi:hypothetical protein
MVVEVVPRKAPVLERHAMEKIVEDVDVFFGKGAQQNAAAVAEDGFLRISVRQEDLSFVKLEDRRRAACPRRIALTS